MGEKYYIFVGCAEGRFEIQNGPDKGMMRDYANMYVLTPASDYKSDDYKATGFKAEKLTCLSPDVWKGLTVGEKCSLFFNDKKQVALATSLGDLVVLQ